MKKYIPGFIAGIILGSVLFSGCSQKPSAAARKAKISFGAAIQVGDVLGDENAEFLTDNFNTVVPENTMKWQLIHPKANYWNWGDMDSIVNFAVRNKMKVRGHTFLWHQQNAPYVSGVKDPEKAKEMLVEHITQIMTRYKGKIYEYDVANEIFEEDGSFRKSFWYETLGEEAYFLAFETARKVDPEARLYLNDYNNECAGTPKADAQYNFMKRMKEKGVPVDGAGFQLHLAEDLNFDRKAIESNIRRYADIGIDVSFTEIDVRIKSPSTEEARKHQGEIYTALMEIAAAEPNVHSYLIWGTTDNKSWVPATFPSYGEALPFTKDKVAKPFMDDIVKAMKR